MPRFSASPVIKNHPPSFSTRNTTRREESLSLTLTPFPSARRDPPSNQEVGFGTRGSRRTSARLRCTPCKIFGLEDGQSGAEPRVESEVDARAQQVLHYVRIRCSTPPRSLTQSNGRPPSPCAGSLLSLSLFRISLPRLTTLCRSRASERERERASREREKQSPTPPRRRRRGRAEKEGERRTVNAAAEARARASSSPPARTNVACKYKTALGQGSVIYRLPRVIGCRPIDTYPPGYPLGHEGNAPIPLSLFVYAELTNPSVLVPPLFPAPSTPRLPLLPRLSPRHPVAATATREEDGGEASSSLSVPKFRWRTVTAPLSLKI